MPLNAQSYFKSQREIHGAKYIGGQEVLVLIVSITGDFKFAVERYCELLQDTYGKDHVKIVGAGRSYYEGSPGQPEEERKITDKKYKYQEYLMQKYFMELINAEQEQGNLYDQIHIVGHGTPTQGIRFLVGKDVFKEKIIKRGFDVTAATGTIGGTSQWPWKPGVKVLLVGCDTDAGLLKSFIEDNGIASNVYVREGEFRCFAFFPVWEGEKGTRIVYAWDSPLQHEATRDIGRYLNIVGE